MRTKESLKKSIFDLLLLSLLTKEDLYGYRLAKIFEDLTNGDIVITTGSMYPTLYKMEENGYISKYLLHGENGKERTYYHIEQAGIEYLKNEVASYYRTANAIDKVLKYGMEEGLDGHSDQ
jgi:PadR family transcriptional regulator PadR